MELEFLIAAFIEKIYYFCSSELQMFVSGTMSGSPGPDGLGKFCFDFSHVLVL
jgi:hypothetical protein